MIFAHCTTCDREQLAFALYRGECYFCRGVLNVTNTQKENER